MATNANEITNKDMYTNLDTDHYLKTKIQCHCTQTSFAVPIPHSALPLKSSLCHCSTCRHSTGQLFATWAVIPTPNPPKEATSLMQSGKLVKYESSTTLQRWFCSRCGASVLNVDRGDGADEWEVGTGVLGVGEEMDDEERGTGTGPSMLEGRLRRVQLWADDVKGDGGAVGWINAGRLQGMDRRWKGRRSEIVSDEAVIKMMMMPPQPQPSTQVVEGGKRQTRRPDQKPESESADDVLRAHCQCRNVAFSISRPRKNDNNNDEDTKIMAALDACTSCRVVTGFEITSWIFVPRDLINVDIDSDSDSDSNLNSFLADRSRLGQYKTSPDVSRYFCVRCGATIFYDKHGLSTIDMAIGLLDLDPPLKGHVRPPENSWVEWEPYPKCLANQEDAVDAEFVRNLAEGMRLWQASGR